jgi:ketosteroid isomerase-like protein
MRFVRPVLTAWALVAVASVYGSALYAQGHSNEAAEVVHAFHAAIAAGDSSGALRLLDPDVVIYESGGVEQSRAEFESHHLGSDIAFAQSTDRTMTEQHAVESGEYAWFRSVSEVRGEFRGRQINSRSTETVILRRSDEGWRIVHIHWSSRPL